MDVAAHAGVSKTTVSLFMGGREDACSPETAQRIRAAVAALHYTPSRATRGLHQRATRIVGLQMPIPAELPGDRRNSFGERLWRGVAEVADVEDYSLLHYPMSARNGIGCDAFLDGSVDGLLFNTGHEDARPERIAAAGMPIVLVTRSLDLPAGCGAVYADEEDTVNLALCHLWALGHRRIAHLAGPAEPYPVAEGNSDDIAIQRRNGYVAFLQKRNVYDPALVAAQRSWHARNALEVVAAWRALFHPPTAVFCANDYIALSVIAAAQKVGWRVPEELSVLGVDNVSIGAEADLPLTTVDIPVEDIGREAMRALLRLMNGEAAEACRVTLPVTQLVVRASTAPAVAVS